MNRFQLCSLVVILLLFTSGIRTSGVSAEHSRQPRQHGFRPRLSISSPFKGQPNTRLGEEKRRVPTGSNPLHNSKASSIFSWIFWETAAGENIIAAL
ncbi:hypothetical protein V6N12_053819 [Hibiscus sabdariffa]|uniref:Uncharacterized protein n=1 Tax=Hibiscus sabdariffa TaxID=183260 RepID=A0ABR2DAE2_9ROSI